MDFFKRIKIKDVMGCLKNIIQCYKDNNIDLYGTGINEELNFNDICIEIDNHSTVLDELDYPGMNAGKERPAPDSYAFSPGKHGNSVKKLTVFHSTPGFLTENAVESGRGKKRRGQLCRCPRLLERNGI